jgi:hypothetical protein
MTPFFFKRQKLVISSLTGFENWNTRDLKCDRMINSSVTSTTMLNDNINFLTKLNEKKVSAQTSNLKDQMYLTLIIFCLWGVPILLCSNTRPYDCMCNFSGVYYFA